MNRLGIRIALAFTLGFLCLMCPDASVMRTAVLAAETYQVGLGEPSEPTVDAGWMADRFPPHAVCYRSPQKIAQIYMETQGRKQVALPSYPKPADGSLRIVGTGHSFMAPAYKTFPLIAEAAGLKQPPLVTHLGGGVTGSARYKWEQENGIFEFDKRPVPKLLASIANAEWDLMMWGPYYHDRPEYYACWIDFCLKYNPDMKFYLMDAWPQIDQLTPFPASEADLTADRIAEMGAVKRENWAKIVVELRKRYPGKIFVLPTCDAMARAAAYYHEGSLPGVEGIHRLVGGKERSLWRDRIGHLGPGFEWLEGYVFYATVYGKSPELISEPAPRRGSGDFPSKELDRAFRKIAWEAVVGNPMSGVTDADGDGIADSKSQ